MRPCVPCACAGSAADAVFAHLRSQISGSSEADVARATGLPGHHVSLALDLLLATGEVLVVRRTRTSTLYGLARR